MRRILGCLATLSVLSALWSCGASNQGVGLTYTDVFVSDATGTDNVFLYDSASNIHTQLTFLTTANAASPSLSSNGQRVVYAAEFSGSSFEILISDVSGNNFRNLSNNAAFDYAPDIDPVSGNIVFASDRSGDLEIYTMDQTGHNVTQLTNSSGVDSFPQYSPDGTKIAFQSSRNGNSDIYTMNADGSGLTQLTTSSAQDEHPAWSPDGTQIVFHSNRTGKYQVYLMNANGSGETQLTTVSAFNGNPSFTKLPPTPGTTPLTYIVFQSDRTGKHQLFAIRPDGTGEIQAYSNDLTKNFKTPRSKY